MENYLVYIDRFTQRYLDDSLTLDFDPIQGFALRNEEEIICRGLTVYLPEKDEHRAARPKNC